jgi:2-keto-4-pentenoate hydratase/2-oxohepta-3-ene-1,7-dioic acid hydratase in catechol pathway
LQSSAGPFACLHANGHPFGHRVVDLGAEGKRKGVALAFDPASMLSLIAAGDAALKQVRALAESAQGEHPKLDDVRLAAPIPYDPMLSTLMDREGELAVIIGKRGRNIPEAAAMSHAFGFSVINDTTARDVQPTRHGGQWFKGKSLDGHGPMGPWIVTRGALNHDNLKLQTIIAELSLGLTLEPVDIIATGTPPGIGVIRNEIKAV